MTKKSKTELLDDVRAAAFASPRGYVCYRAARTVNIDGTGRDAAWLDASWTDDFVDIQGCARPLPRLRTRVRMLHDDTHLYVHAELEEPHVWATITERNAVIFHDNDFEIFVDPDGDNHDYYELEINAFNTTWQLSLPVPYRAEGRPVDPHELPGLRTAVHVGGTLNDPRDTDRGWSVEMAIPFAGLARHVHDGRACPPRDGDQWRVNFSRVQWRHEVVDGAYRKLPDTPEDNWVWSPQGVVDMHRPNSWGYVQFSDHRAGDATVLLRPDPTRAARNLLMAYWEQRRAGRGVDDPMSFPWPQSAAEIAIEDDGARWTARTPVDTETGRATVWVNERGRLWVT